VTFEAITRERVITSQFAPGMNADIEHIALASTMDLLLVAPATANIIGKFANGIADDFLSALYLATRAPVLMAPAMNTNMWDHPAVVSNMATLTARGVRFVDPGEGYLACGWVGKGRLAEPEMIAEAADRILRPQTALSGQRILVTAGPTFEDLDPVRFLGNRSSGRMGFAIAEEATRRGADRDTRRRSDADRTAASRRDRPHPQRARAACRGPVSGRCRRCGHHGGGGR
jgi:phosphopantothenoylcysteine decarboxylase/phosphopantothenate--cysteine ligase